MFVHCTVLTVFSFACIALRSDHVTKSLALQRTLEKTVPSLLAGQEAELYEGRQSPSALCHERRKGSIRVNGEEELQERLLSSAEKCVEEMTESLAEVVETGSGVRVAGSIFCGMEAERVGRGNGRVGVRGGRTGLWRDGTLGRGTVRNAGRSSGRRAF